jgi:NADPH:quinone reductase-like Zn-dependent oxidoreductase
VDRDATVVVWGGSTSVGCSAIQFAVAAGYRVVTTASPHDHDLVRRLGAVEAFDHNGATVVEDLRRSLVGRRLAGAVGRSGMCFSCIAGTRMK